ncbi:hypothetical protein Taro_022164 [Colocasia esculenta]|uniref:Protein NRT1/ PTR FAMILY 5.10 n=1 Tax=Colocasia esculenta TaxID=4460 RepID=A0A843UTP8_COLES|nr:hypothetical protein [Colocasia esculenta]
MEGAVDADPLIGSGPLPLDGVADYLGRPLSSRSASGGWTSALFIIGVEIAERCAYYGVSSNLITYLTGPLGQSTASAAANVNAWSGAASMLPLLGGFLADAYVGRYRAIVFASLLYVLGLGMLTLSATVPSLRPPQCSGTSDPEACRPTPFLVAFFFFSIYLVAFAQGGHKPCVQAFGADQFDENDPEESKSKSSFFNWWFFGMSVGIGVTHVVVNYVQDSIGWGLGFGLPCLSMAVALVVFLMGTRTYRYYPLTTESLFTEFARVCDTLWRRPSPMSNSGTARLVLEDGAKEPLLLEARRQFFKPHGQQESRKEVEDVQGVLRLFPIGATCLIYAVVDAQPPTLFTKQGSTMDRRIGPSLLAPPAALQSITSVSIITFLPIYDRVLVPLARKLTGIPTGVTMLQRIGIGMVLSIAAMLVAALVEMKRLQTARDFGLLDLPNAVVPMSLWWLVPQYVLYGISDVFILVGLQEFFYDQVPDGLRSLGLALYLTIFGIGSFISSFLVSVIDRATRKSGDSWFSDNLNRAHLDYFYWLLAGLSVVGLLLYLCFARAFQYKKKASDQPRPTRELRPRARVGEQSKSGDAAGGGKEGGPWEARWRQSQIRSPGAALSPWKESSTTSAGRSSPNLPPAAGPPPSSSSRHEQLSAVFSFRRTTSPVPRDLPVPVSRLRTWPGGGGRCCSCRCRCRLSGAEIAERCAYYGASSNLITYLTGPLGLSTASAAANVNAWSGAASMLPLLGGFLADAHIGRYRTIVFASLLYVLGLGMLTLSATVPSLRPPQCSGTSDPEACRPTPFQVAFFFFSLYLLAFAQGGHKPCVQAFGADQFDESGPEESKSKSSFFNWWFFGMSIGIGVTLVVVNYVQDSIGWGLGFGLPCVSMAVALVVFLMGTRTYRYYPPTSESELARVCAMLWRRPPSPMSSSGRARLDLEDGAKEPLLPETGRQFFSEEVEDVQGFLRLFPIGATCLIYTAVFAQPPTLFTKQGSTMDRRIGPSLLAPPAALQSFSSVSIITFLPIYDRVLVPLARKLTGIPTGVTMLQRMGIGMVVSIAAMVVAALVEMKRLQTARDFGLVDLPNAVVPMSLWWLVPQYVLAGISDVFTMVGLQEFFYDQVPDGLRSVGLALYLTIFGIGSFISSFLVYVIDRATRKSGDSWFSNNLNRAHLDYFYWLLAGLNVVGLLLYLWFARVFQYKRKGNTTA